MQELKWESCNFQDIHPSYFHGWLQKCSDKITDLPLPNQLATTATTGGQPDDWNRPHMS